MPLAAPVDKIKSLACSLIEQNNLDNGYVYIQMTRGVAERNHLYERDLTSFLTGFTKEMTFPRDKHNGISLYATEDIRWLRCDIKTLNLLGNIMAKRKAADHNCEEALQHRGDVVTEGSSSNIFMVKNKNIYTHPANNFILNGITRQVVISLAGDLKYNVIEEAFSLDDIEQLMRYLSLAQVPKLHRSVKFRERLKVPTLSARSPKRFKKHFTGQQTYKWEKKERLKKKPPFLFIYEMSNHLIYISLQALILPDPLHCLIYKARG